MAKPISVSGGEKHCHEKKGVYKYEPVGGAGLQFGINFRRNKDITSREGKMLKLVLCVVAALMAGSAQAEMQLREFKNFTRLIPANVLRGKAYYGIEFCPFCKLSI